MIDFIKDFWNSLTTFITDSWQSFLDKFIRPDFQSMVTTIAIILVVLLILVIILWIIKKRID